MLRYRFVVRHAHGNHNTKFLVDQWMHSSSRRSQGDTLQRKACYGNFSSWVLRF